MVSPWRAVDGPQRVTLSTLVLSGSFHSGCFAFRNWRDIVASGDYNKEYDRKGGTIMSPLLIVLGIVVVIGLYLFTVYNGLVTLKEQIKEAWSQIDVHLKRRGDLIPIL